MYGDTNGNVFFADTCNIRVRSVSTSTGNITTLAGTGITGYGGEGGKVYDGIFIFP
jgi:hypothetical protein